MASAAQEIVDKLNTLGVGTKGTNLFRGAERPSGDYIPTNAIFVAPGAASQAPEAVSGDMGAVVYGSVQILVRNHVYSVAMNKATSVFNALAGQDTINNTIGHFMEQGYPIFLGEDAQRFYRFAVNITLIQVASAIGSSTYGSATYGSSVYG